MNKPITIFACPKPFSGHVGVIQRNAIESWSRLYGGCQILLLGEEEGVREAARDIGALHIPDVRVNERGTPLLNSIFEKAEQVAKNKLRMFINADIILLDDFFETAQRIPFPKFLAVGQRWNLDIKDPIDFTDPDIFRTLKESALNHGELFSTAGIDYFLYRGVDMSSLPPMVIGRGGFDRWLIYYCFKQKVPVVDISESAFVIHQNHDYAHIHGGQKAAYKTGEEAQENLRLSGGRRYYFSISDADLRAVGDNFERNYCRNKSEKCGEKFRVLHEDIPVLKSNLVVFFYELWCELVIRLRYLKQGDVRYVLKFVPWVILKIFRMR